MNISNDLRKYNNAKILALFELRIFKLNYPFFVSVVRNRRQSQEKGVPGRSIHHDAETR